MQQGAVCLNTLVINNKADVVRRKPSHSPLMAVWGKLSNYPHSPTGETVCERGSHLSNASLTLTPLTGGHFL